MGGRKETADKEHSEVDTMTGYNREDSQLMLLRTAAVASSAESEANVSFSVGLYVSRTSGVPLAWRPKRIPIPPPAALQQ